MATPLASVAMLEIRLGLAAGTLADLDLARASAALSDASDLVRAEARMPWVDAAPPAVMVVVLQIAMRAYNNPNGYAGESYGQYAWQADQQSLGIYLTDDELRTVQAARTGGTGWTGTGSVRTPSTWHRRPTGDAPWEWTP